MSTPLSHGFFVNKDSESEISFLECLLKFATHDELIMLGESEGIPNKKLLFSTKEEDSEFKKLLWSSILYIIKDEENKVAHQYVIQVKQRNKNN